MAGPQPEATAYLGLGSNLGDRLAALRGALCALENHPCIRVDMIGGVASLYETSPIGVGADQPVYLNSAVRVTTALAPPALLETTLTIEASLGRVRRQRWGARTIDLDLLLYDDLVINDARLTVPHPELARRRFVLEPLAEIAGEVLHPVLGVTIATLARQVHAPGAPDAPLRVADGGWPYQSCNIARSTDTR